MSEFIDIKVRFTKESFLKLQKEAGEMPLNSYIRKVVLIDLIKKQPKPEGMREEVWEAYKRSLERHWRLGELLGDFPDPEDET